MLLEYLTVLGFFVGGLFGFFTSNAKSNKGLAREKVSINLKKGVFHCSRRNVLKLSF